MKIVLKIVIFAAVLFVTFLIFDFDKLKKTELAIVGIPIIFGTLCLVFSFDMTMEWSRPGWPWERKSTPGCVWIAFGILCWVFAICYYLAETSG